MRDNFTVTERILWDKVSEFSFKGFTDLAKHLKMLLSLRKLHKDRKYHIIISEVEQMSGFVVEDDTPEVTIEDIMKDITDTIASKDKEILQLKQELIGIKNMLKGLVRKDKQ